MKNDTLLSCIIFLTLICYSFNTLASPQVPDLVIYKGDTIPTYNLLVEKYLQDHHTSDGGKLFGLSFRNGGSFTCWRGYQAIYKIQHDSLFLSDMVNCGARFKTPADRDSSLKKMQLIFGEKLVDGRVFIDWFSGDLNFPLNKTLIRWDGVFNTIFEEETVLNIVNGAVTNAVRVNNYVDDPKAINRRYKDKISDILFKELKKAKWKSSDECDCGEDYLITINESGRVSKVVMQGYDNEEEIEKHFELEEYNYCINTILKTLSKLRFDVVKQRGKPIIETVHLKLWFDDNKIENWTH